MYICDLTSTEVKFFGVLLVGFTQKYKMNIKFSVKVHSIQGLLRQSQMLFSSFLSPAFLLVNLTSFLKSCLEMWVSSDPPPLTKRQGLVEVAEFAVCWFMLGEYFICGKMNSNEF